MPSGLTTTRPTAVRSKASRTRSKSRRAASGATALMGGSANLRRGHGRGGGRRTAERLARARAEALGEALEHVLLGREVHQLLGLDHLARDVLGAADAVGEAQLHALRARPHQAGEHL